jgi:hypothetical protein
MSFCFQKFYPLDEKLSRTVIGFTIFQTALLGAITNMIHPQAMIVIQIFREK